MSGPSSRQLVMASLLFLFVGIAVHGRVVGNGYAFDAYYTVRDNPQVQPDASLVEIFSSPYWTGEAAAGRGLYRPLAVLSFQLPRRISEEPLAFDHAFDLGLHVLCTLSLMAFLMQMGARFGVAATLALVFLVHPVHTEVVASLVGRTDLLATLSALLALNLTLARGVPVGVAWVGVAGLFSLSLLAKESAVGLVLILPFCWVAREAWSGGETAKLVRKGLGLTTVLGFALIAHLVLRQWVLGDLMVEESAIQGDESRGFFELRWRALGFASLYVQKLVWPYPLIPDYLTGVVPALGAGLHLRAVFAGALLLASLAWPAWSWVRTRSLSRTQVGVLLFWMAMAPVSNILIQIGTPFGERLLYFPMIFALLAAVDLPLWRSIKTGGIGRAPRAWPVWVIVFAVMGLISAGRIPEWKNNRTLFEAAVEDHPGNYYSQMAFGATLMRDGGGPYERERAVAAFRAASRIRKEAYPPWAMLGQLAYQAADYATARSFFEEAHLRAEGIELEPSLLNLARTYRALRDFPRAESLLVPAAASHPEWVAVQRELGDYWISKENPTAAIPCFERVLARQPNDLAASRALIRAYLAIGERDEAAARIESAPAGTVDTRFKLQLERDGLGLPN